jgi:hypothetical protein
MDDQTLLVGRVSDVEPDYVVIGKTRVQLHPDQRSSAFVEGYSAEVRLREQARNAIQNGKIPSRAPDRTWGGPGVGARCTVCDRPVTRDDLEFEIQFEKEGTPPGDGDLDKFHVHVRCFAAWEFERSKPAL